MEARNNNGEGMFAGTAAAAGAKPITPTPQPIPTAPKVIQPKTQALKELENETANAVLLHVTSLQESGDLILPANYAPGNQLKLAWFNLMEVTDRNGKPALEVCTRASIANTLLEMVVKGLSVTKKQCDFIVRGDKLTLQEEYHGTIALARRFGGVVGVPTGNVIYEGDIFEYAIDPLTGRKKITKHEQKLENIDLNKIIGAYATLQLSDGGQHVEIMTMAQIRQAWMQGPMKGQSPAHKNFPDQMCIKTVIGRGCKLFISSSDDAALIGDVLEEKAEKMPTATPEQPKQKPLKEMPIEEGKAVVIETKTTDQPNGAQPEF